MTPIQFIIGLEIILFVAAIVWFFYGPWQRLVVEIARQGLLELRNSVFLLAASGELSFDSPEYKYARKKLNSRIGLAHHYTWLLLIAEHFSTTKADEANARLIQDEMVLPDAIEKRLNASTYVCIALMVVRSPFLLFVTPLLILAAGIAYLCTPSGMRYRLLRFSRIMDTEIGLSHA